MPDYNYYTTWTADTYTATDTTTDYVIYLDEFAKKIEPYQGGFKFKSPIRFQGNPMILFAQRCAA